MFVGDTEGKFNGDDAASFHDLNSPMHKQVTGAVQERDFTGTPYVPVYVILPAGTINLDCELVDPDELINQLRMLKSINVDGFVIDCWWGIVETHAPNQHNWSGYKKLFSDCATS